MTTRDELLDELFETKYSIQNNDFNSEKTKRILQKIDLTIKKNCLSPGTNKNNIIKSLLITFNVSNFSDLTVLFISTFDKVSIIEYAGNAYLLNEFNSLIENDKKFYKSIDTIRIKENNFRILFESMENDKGIYTILTITESLFFKPSKFHMLGDILMEIIRSTDMSSDSVFNDLFEDTAIGINSYISQNNITDSDFYLFKFENIYDFFLKMVWKL